MGTQEINTLILATFAVISLMCAGFVTILYFHRNRRIRHQNEKRLLQQEHREALLSTQLEIQSQTMQQIGREIHDNVGQQLTLASLYAQQLAYENKAPQVKEAVERISNIINQSLQELRQLSRSLTDDNIAQNSIAVLLKTECDKVNDSKKYSVRFTSEDLQDPLSYQVKSIIVRIVQEFLQNSIRHSGCTMIQLSLHTDSAHFHLHAADNGRGFDTSLNQGNGAGLVNMRKRAEMIGGIFVLESNSRGTRLHISIPLLQS